jgi:ribosomal protein S18 acetylase RimI-like enzyme
MKSPAVRRATAADVDAVAAIAASRPFAAKWSRADLIAELARSESLFLVAEGGRGYALARVDHGEARLLDFASAADGEGAGRALWAALVAAAREEGAQRVTLECSSANARALAFYAAAGAEVVGRRKKFYDDGSDAVLLDLVIP